VHDDAVHVVVNLARQIGPGDVVFTGVNSAAAVAACLLAKRCAALKFTHLNVAGGVDATVDVLPASSGDPALLSGTASIFANEDFYDLCLRGGVDVVFLGAAQVDALGRTNVSAIGNWHAPRVRLPGGGGAATMLPTARRTVVWQTVHSSARLVENVDFVTAAGATALVTPLAVFTRERDGRFALTTHRADCPVEELRSRTGFAFSAADARPTAEPTSDELAVLERLDRDRILDRVFAGR
jgi:glutaconate CoA-transferase subunit B